MIATYRGSDDQRALHLDLRRPHRERLATSSRARTCRTCGGVACAPERSAWATIRHHCRAPRPRATEPDSTATRRCSSALDVLDPRRRTRHAALEARADRRGAARLGRRGCVVAPAQALRARRCEGSLTRRGTVRAAPRVRAVLGRARAAAAEPGRPELPAQVEDRRELTDRRRRPRRALLMQEGILTPFPDNTLRPNAPHHPRPGRRDARAQPRCAAAPPGLVSAEFRGIGPAAA